MTYSFLSHLVRNTTSWYVISCAHGAGKRWEKSNTVLVKIVFKMHILKLPPNCDLSVRMILGAVLLWAIGQVSHGDQDLGDRSDAEQFRSLLRSETNKDSFATHSGRTGAEPKEVSWGHPPMDPIPTEGAIRSWCSVIQA